VTLFAQRAQIRFLEAFPSHPERYDMVDIEFSFPESLFADGAAVFVPSQDVFSDEEPRVIAVE